MASLPRYAEQPNNSSLKTIVIKKTDPLFNSNRQLEILLSVEICNLYQMLLGHRPNLITCCFIEDQELTLVFEDFLTPMEKMLLKGGRPNLVLEARQSIDTVVHRQLKLLMKKSSNRRVLNLLSDVDILTNRKIIYIILSPNPPHFTSPQV